MWCQACEGAGKEPEVNAIEWAFEVLKDKDLGSIRNALIAHARHPKQGQFLPKPADIIRELEGTADDKKNAATVAFARVLENVGRYNSVVFDDPAIHYALAVGFNGKWADVCNFNENDFACQDKKRGFMSAYISFKQGMNYPKRFAGVAEMDGEDYRKCLKVVGNVDQARIVHQGGSSSGLQSLDVAKAMHSLEPALKGIEDD